MPGSIFRVTLAALIAALLVAAVVCADDLPVVVVRVDDCESSWLTSRAELDNQSPMHYAKQARIPITWAIIVDAANSGGVSWQDFKDYLDYAGGEPASHSYHHSSTSSTADAAAELASNRQSRHQSPKRGLPAAGAGRLRLPLCERDPR